MDEATAAKIAPLKEAVRLAKKAHNEACLALVDEWDADVPNNARARLLGHECETKQDALDQAEQALRAELIRLGVIVPNRRPGASVSMS